MSHTVSEAISLILEEVRNAAGAVKPESVKALGEAALSAQAVFVAGEGRSGLVAKCLAMRLMHLGLETHVVGEAVTPAFSADDLLIVFSGSGETAAACTIARAAKEQGGKVATVTTGAGSSLGALADVTVVIPVGQSLQFGGSLFEQAALLVCDSLTLILQQRLGQSETDMRSRHATLE
jgi:6-phospho 3-hexuloisomerase